jgi:hypothetical protein
MYNHDKAECHIIRTEFLRHSIQLRVRPNRQIWVPSAKSLVHTGRIGHLVETLAVNHVLAYFLGSKFLANVMATNNGNTNVASA